jgi:hypothetical protein
MHISIVLARKVVAQHAAHWRRIQNPLVTNSPFFQQMLGPLAQVAP